MKLDWSALPDLFPMFASGDQWLPLLEIHAHLLGAAAPEVKVTSVPKDDEVRRHYAECLELGAIMQARGCLDGTLIDVGSGGGFPGLILAAVSPNTTVALVEPLKKRAGLLARASEAMGLSNVQVVPSRAEEAARGPLRGSAAAVTARAVAELRVLLEYTAPFAQPGGQIFLPKGSGFDAELEQAANALTGLQCEFEEAVPMRPSINPLAVVGVFRCTGAADPRYPRRAGLPSRRPL